MKNSAIIIAIDGHSSCGKSTMAKELAKKLNYIYIDSGAMYRAITLYSIQNKLWDNETILVEKLQQKIDTITISFVSKNHTTHTFLNGIDVEDQIRTLEVSSKVSLISALAFVRDKMVALQQKMGENKGIVMDGRDIGTTVFPNAELKVFVTASPKIRAERRFKELTLKGSQVSFEEVLQNLQERDVIDSSRDISPLIQAKDALLLDNSNLSLEEQNQQLLKWALEKIAND